MLTVRPMTSADSDAVLAIYQAGIDTGMATFETAVPSWVDFDAKRLPTHRFVAAGDGGRVLGWVACGQVSWREVYRGVVEHGVYIAPEARGQGVGVALMRALIESTEAAGIWTIQSSVFPENAASLALHDRVGFRRIGHREKVACLAGQWRDVVLLERRSQVVGCLS